MSIREKSFSQESFKAPSQEYAPIYSWVWNGPISKETIDAQIAEMDRLRIKAFYIIPEPKTFRPTSMPTHLEPDYLTHEYFQYYRYAMNKAREYGMKCWIYDEAGWPSGGACGRVLFEYPEYAKRRLRSYSKKYKTGEAYHKGENDVAAFLSERMLEDGYIFDTDAEVTVYESHVSAWEAPGIQDYPDLTVKEATQAFIRITHEKYKEYLGDDLGNLITAVFTDEPKAPNLPFREELCKIYEETYGESIIPHLPMLLGKVPLNDENIKYRRRWFDICSRAYCENFLLECKRWANANGMQFTGHLDKDDTPDGCMSGCNFHVMRALRCFDLPGIDVIWRQIFSHGNRDIYVGGASSGKEAENRFFPRYASSAAYQTGNDLSLTESMGVYGYGVTFDQMRYVLGFQAIRGVTVMNLMLLNYHREGNTMYQEAPGFAEVQGCHRDLGEFNRYLERLSYTCSRGERICDTALYYPIGDIWGKLHSAEISNEFEALGRAMEAHGIDFDILDDDVILQERNICDGKIRMGKACYRKIAIPAGAYISDEVRERLKQFCEGGGVVVTDANDLSPNLDIIGGNGMIRVMKRLVDGCDFICLFNESDEPQTFSVKIGAACGYYVDITKGCLYSAMADESGAVTVSLERGETCAIYLSSEALTTEEKPKALMTVRIDTPFTFRRIDSFVIGKHRPEYRVLEERDVPASLGEWSSMTGRDFTGSAIYTTRFASPIEDAVLDLGDVRHSCEVFLNGRSLGVRLMKPYSYDIPGEMMKEDNLLQIRVSNTAANQYQYTKSFDKYKPWQLSIYREAQDMFDRDSLDSGLFGPVTLGYK